MKILGIYYYGSTIYGTITDKSDIDLVIITTNDIKSIEYHEDVLDVTYFSERDYLNNLHNHDLKTLEVYYQNIFDIPNKDYRPIRKYNVDNFRLDKVKLRHVVSSTCSNSYVKAKKKITLSNEDNYIGIKSLFHSIRIPIFAIDIILNNNPFCNLYINKIWIDILNDAKYCNYDWDYLHEKYKPIYNANMSSFRKLAPKK